MSQVNWSCWFCPSVACYSDSLLGAGRRGPAPSQGSCCYHFWVSVHHKWQPAPAASLPPLCRDLESPLPSQTPALSGFLGAYVWCVRNPSSTGRPRCTVAGFLCPSTQSCAGLHMVFTGEPLPPWPIPRLGLGLVSGAAAVLLGHTVWVSLHLWNS